MKYIIIIAMLFSFNCNADDMEDVHLAAHVGMSYAINTFLYGFNTKALTLTEKDAMIFSAFETFMIGMTYEWLTLNSGDHIVKALSQNATGILFSTGTIIMFRF